MIENEIAAAREAMEQVFNTNAEAINRFANAVNKFSEKVDLLLARDAVTTPAPVVMPEEEDKPAPAKKKATKKKAAKKAEPKPEPGVEETTEPDAPVETVTVADVRKLLVAAVSAGGSAVITTNTKKIMDGMNLAELPDNDPKLLKLKGVAEDYLASVND